MLRMGSHQSQMVFLNHQLPNGSWPCENGQTQHYPFFIILHFLNQADYMNISKPSTPNSPCTVYLPTYLGDLWGKSCSIFQHHGSLFRHVQMVIPWCFSIFFGLNVASGDGAITLDEFTKLVQSPKLKSLSQSVKGW